MTAQPVALSELAGAAPGVVDSPSTATITGLAHDSCNVQPGDLFFCVPGATHDGHRFAPEAVERGAAGLVVERPLNLACPQLKVASVRKVMGPISSRFYGHPSHSMTVVGVTGTNGKTTVTRLLASVLSAAGFRTETIGTLTGTLTTPESLDLHRKLACWRSKGVTAVAMEVSSHALHQHRVDGVHFDVGVFTNLTPDHLDYHGTIEEYHAAKTRLFTPELSDRAVVNLSDEHGRRLGAEPAVPTVGFDPRRMPVELGSGGSTLRWRGYDIRLALIGRFNAANALAAAEAGLLLGADIPKVVAGLEAATPVPGRFEVIESNHPFTVVVDFAHTPDGLAQVLTAARELVSGAGRLRVVFGCGGERDTGKRPMMGRAAAELADHTIITSDNPRSEDPEAIIAGILAGIPSQAGRFSTQPDRREAIAQALAHIAAGDVVVVAGKGHETTQTVGDRVIPFDDRVVIREILDEREQAS